MNYWLLFIPLLTAFTGWAIIFFIRRSIFKPVLPVYIFGFKVQGLLPRNRQYIITRVGELAASAFSSQQVSKSLEDPKHFAAIRPTIEAHMDDFLRHRLKDQMPMISMFIGDKTIESLKVIFIKEIEDLFPRIMQQFSNELRHEFDIPGLVNSAFTSAKMASLEDSLSDALRKDLKKAGYLAALAGLLIGIIQLVIVLAVTGT